MNVVTVDIDDTLITSDMVVCGCCGAVSYENYKPIVSEIEHLRHLSGIGYRVILYTGRGWDKYEMTKKMLVEMEIPYDELIMGKPPGPYIDKTMNKLSLGEIKHG